MNKENKIWINKWVKERSWNVRKTLIKVVGVARKQKYEA